MKRIGVAAARIEPLPCNDADSDERLNRFLYPLKNALEADILRRTQGRPKQANPTAATAAAAVSSGIAYRDDEHRADVDAYCSKNSALYEKAALSGGNALDPFQEEAQRWHDQLIMKQRALYYMPDHDPEPGGKDSAWYREQKEQLQRECDELQQAYDALPILLTKETLENPYAAKYADLLSIRTPNAEQRKEIRKAMREMYPISNLSDSENIDWEAYAVSHALYAKLPATAVVTAVLDDQIPWVNRKTMERDALMQPEAKRQLEYMSVVTSTDMASWSAKDIAEAGIAAINIAQKIKTPISMVDAVLSDLKPVEMTRKIVSILLLVGIDIGGYIAF